VFPRHGIAKVLSPLHLSKKLESIVVLKTIAVCSEQMMRMPRDTQKVSMRKVVASEFVSLDGVMEDPSLTFQFTAKARSLEEPSDGTTRP
jgi:hypothetical protein